MPPSSSPTLPDYRVVILGAAPTVRKDLPPAMVPVGGQRRTLDWLLTAFESLTGTQVEFVSGFMANEVMRHYPGMRCHYNAAWASTGPARSLALAPLESRIATFVCYSDVVFRSDTVESMTRADADIVVAADRCWKVRYDGRSSGELDSAEKVALDGQRLRRIGKDIRPEEADAEFAGLLMLSSRTARRLQNILSSEIFGDRDGIPEILSFLLDHDLEAVGVDVEGQWAELNAPQDLARFVLGTKAESLERLRPLLRAGVIGELRRYTARQWAAEREQVLEDITHTFPGVRVVVRSSSRAEDGFEASSAGAFTSVLDVPADDATRLAAAVDQVFDSYGDAAADDQVLVQEMVTDVRLSGVVMTRTHAHNAPYYVVNYDDTSSRTDTVTSGEGRSLRTLFLHRSERIPPDEGALGAVMAVVHELEELVGHESLDIEFAVDAAGVVHVLQVRPIATIHPVKVNDESVERGVAAAKASFTALQRPSPFVLGRSTCLSVMSDWNPAEIVGTKPRRLALSIYRHVITDDTWARQRAEYGYRDVRPQHLLVDLLGHPYVDVRATFNSFVPAALDNDLATRLVEHYLQQLEANPELHDKVEFEVLFTCWSFDFAQRSRRLLEAGFSVAEVDALAAALLDVTRFGMRRVEDDHAALELTRLRHAAIASAGVHPLERALLHLENAREYGTLHFSHLARAGFVAATLLRSMVAVGGVSQREVDDFMSSVRTVSVIIQEDAARVASGDLSWEDFVLEYGHLRPGTYDIGSPRYDSSPAEFLAPMIERAARPQAERLAGFQWSSDAVDRMAVLLEESGLDVDLARLESFLRRAISGREYAKFVFTRDLSDALEALAEYGEEHFVSREEISHIRLQDLLALRAAGFKGPSAAMHELAREGLEACQLQQAICFPEFVFRPGDLSRFEHREAIPNYVTSKKVRAALLPLDATTSPDSVELEGRIALIPNADPGFDWVFSRGIAGLITMYGGANSHMAIRMAEFQLPGVTGVGELLYARLLEAAVVELDCAGRQVRVVD